jgi:hypothetical protein
MRPLWSSRALVLGIAGLAAVAMICLLLPRAQGEAPPSASAATAGLPFQLPVGDVDLDIDEPQLDEKMGGAFALGLRSGARNCYVETEPPLPEGEITFTVKPPPQEGNYLVTLAKTGSITDALVACVKGVFGNFYHYANKEAFDQVQGTLSFTPHTITAPSPPTDTELRAQLDERYKKTPVVRIAKIGLNEVSNESGGSNEFFRRYYYSVDLEFVSAGYEAICQHYELYKVFGPQPYQTPFMGHTCENHARRAGDHVVDQIQLTYRLVLWPEVGKRWEPLAGGITGTRPD